jgi:hypothetical protein
MNDVVTAEYQEVGVPAISDTTLVQLAEQAEKRIDAMNKIKKCALKMTNARDWSDQNGKPYLEVSGSEKVARLYGISWRIDEPVFELEDDGHFSYTYKGAFSLAGATIEAIGTRSSKDGFFARYEGYGEDRTKLPPSAIDKGDVKKSAYTNLLGNGITRILGLRNMTWEDLMEFAGITQEQVKSVDYKKNGKKQEKIQSEGALSANAQVEDVRKQTGKGKNGKEYTKFIIKGGGHDYSTFSETIAQTAKDHKDTGTVSKLTYTENQYGRNLEAIGVGEPETSKGREPGQEG